MVYQTTKCFNRGKIRRKNSRGLQYDAESAFDYRDDYFGYKVLIQLEVACHVHFEGRAT